MSKCLAFSGGLDSACAWWVTGKPHALFVAGPHGPARGAAYAEARAVEEMSAICPEFRDRLVVVPMDCRPFMRPGIWKFPRNEVCALAAWGAGFDGVSFAWVKDDNPTQDHIARQSAQIRFAVSDHFPFSVDFPCWHMTKAELIRAALDAGAPIEFLSASYSCVTGSKPCGACINCKQRESAFREAGVLVG